MATLTTVRRGAIYRPGRIRRMSLGEHQDRLDATDASLPREAREAYPVVPFGRGYEDIERAYPELWVALLPTRVDDHGNDVEGRVLGAATSRDEIDDRLARLHALYPGVHPLVIFTGQSPTLGQDIAIV